MVAIPLRTSVFARARWLVLAPHADDETLGAGALIRETARAGRLAGVAYLTDGSGSHPHIDHGRRQALIQMRRREAGLAVRRLGPTYRTKPLFLGWQDATPCEPASAPFRSTRDRLAALCRLRRIDAIAVTAEHEPHCDHAAAFNLAKAVCRVARRQIALFEYHVWSAPPVLHARTYQTGSMPLGLRRHALAAHRSQLTSAFGDGFRLAKAQSRMAARDRLYLREHPHAA